MASGSETVRPTRRFPDYGPCDIEDWKEFLTQENTRVSDCLNGKRISQEGTLNDLEQETLLGSGSYGDVILVKHKKNGNYFAMKVVEKERVIKQKQLEHLKNEMNVLKCIDFPLLVYLVFCFKDNSFIYMVMPFIPGGELYYHLIKFEKFDEAQAKFFASQVILALEYLHSLDLVYRDLKPENILVDQTGYLKVTDFGFCKRLTKPRTYTLCGTPEYMAPEVILNKGYGKSIDWWAIGVLMYEMVAGISPFFEQTDIKIYEKIVAVQYNIPQFFSSELKDLVGNIFQADVTKRFGNLKNGVEDIKGHQWFKSIDWMAILNRKVEAPWKPKYTSPGDVRNFVINKWKQPVISKTNLYAKEFEDF